MSWQEELRKLDEELAAGRISADDYRVRRDQVLSSAVSQAEPATPQPGHSSGGQQQPGGKPAADSTQVISPVSKQQGNQQPAQPSSAAEPNQPAPNAGSPPQQAAGPVWQPHQPVQQGPQQAQPASPAGGFQQPPQQPWNAPDQDMTPPWGSSDFPPPDADASPEGAAQGPEGFESSSRSGKRRTIAVTSAGVVVLLVVGALIFFIASGKSGQTQATGGTPQSPEPPPATTAVSTTPPRERAGALLVPRGQVQGPETFTQKELLNSKALPEPGRVIVKQVGIAKARSVFAVKDGITTTLWSFQTDHSTKLYDKLNEDQKRFGFEKVSPHEAALKVFTAVQRNDDKEVFVYRTHYIADSGVVRVQSFGTDKASVRNRFDTILNAQLTHAPATN